MAKTNWVLNEIVMPADMNQIGTEINAKAEKNNIETTGYSLRDNRFLKRYLGSFSTINSSPNQKIKITFPTNPTNYNFHGDIKLSVGGGYYGTISVGVVSKKLSGTITNGGAVEFDSRYTELSGRIFDKIKISDMRFDAVNKQAFILVEYIPNINANQQFSFDIEVNERSVSSPANFKNFFTGITISNWYADTEVLPTAYVQERQLQLTAPQGTPALVVTSTTKVDNLNADSVDGWNFLTDLSEVPSYNPATTSMGSLAGLIPVKTMLRFHITPSVNPWINITNGLPTNDGILEIFRLDANTARLMFTTAPSSNVAQHYVGYANQVSNSFVFTGWKQVSFNGSPISSTQLTSTAPQGTAPLVVTSNTKVDNLNSDLLDGMHADVNKTASTIVARKSDGGINTGGFSSFEQIGVKLPGRNRELRLTQDANNISYLQLVNDSGGFISNPIQINADGTTGLNASTNVISYTNPATPQVRNTHVGNTAPSNSLGINGDIYIEL